MKHKKRSNEQSILESPEKPSQGRPTDLEHSRTNILYAEMLKVDRYAITCKSETDSWSPC